MVIIEGGEFGASETSILFGDGCPSLSPSVSPGPTNTPTFSNRPSSSARPSTEYIPSAAPSESDEKVVEHLGSQCTNWFSDGLCTECSGKCWADSDCAGSLRCAAAT